MSDPSQKNRDFLAAREAAVRSSHDPADLRTIMRPYHYPKGEGKIMVVSVQADDRTEGGIIIPGMAQVPTGECVVVDIDDKLMAKGDLGLSIGQRVQVAKYMGSNVKLREVWKGEDGQSEVINREYITMDPCHVLNTFEVLP